MLFGVYLKEMPCGYVAEELPSHSMCKGPEAGLHLVTKQEHGMTGGREYQRGARCQIMQVNPAIHLAVQLFLGLGHLYILITVTLLEVGLIIPF